MGKNEYSSRVLKLLLKKWSIGRKEGRRGEQEKEKGEQREQVRERIKKGKRMEEGSYQ